jgi:omega-6 fatty acid desaturase (delta-12 desaturase)
LQNTAQDRAAERERALRFTRMLEPYWGADTRRSVTQLLTSAVPFVAFWYAMLRSIEVSYALTLLLALPTSGFLMRLFIIQHDCGHGSFFRSRRARDWVGFVIGVVTLIPYQYWRKTHAYHHAHSGDLDFRGFGDIDTLTVREYQALPRLRRLAYRLYRNPIVLLGIGPAFHFVVKHRYPWDIPRDWKQAWRSVWWTNAAIAGIVLALGLAVGWQRFLMVQLPVTLFTASVGVLLFYVQHQFEETYWHRHGEWDFFDAALRGSSFLELPKPLQWITGNIGLHHVHHLSSRIPNYRLQECMDANADLQTATRIGLLDGWRLLGLTLWDEEARRLIGFGELARMRSARPVPA